MNIITLILLLLLICSEHSFYLRLIFIWLIIVDSIHHCADNLDRFDTKWNRTVENTLVTVTCTGEYTGTVSRNCSSGGMWNEPDYTQCISKSIKNIKTQVINVLIMTTNCLFSHLLFFRFCPNRYFFAWHVEANI